MSLKIKQIFLPKPNQKNEYVSYENQQQPKLFFGNAELETLFQSYKAEIMKLVEKEIEDYINCDDVCNDDEDMFPRRSFLTGEWYLRSIYFEDLDFLSICTAFLGTDLGYKEDYLELEVFLYYNKELECFVFDGINSESI